MKSLPLASACKILCAGLCTVVLGCRPTVDYLGYDRVEVLVPLACPAPYRSAYRDVLNKTQTEIDSKLTTAFNQLFHGSADQTIYFASGIDQASIKDIFHGSEVRTEGMGLSMLICAMLNRQDEFDRLWRYSKARLAYPRGTSLEGYFRSRCDVIQILPLGSASASTECADPYGFEQYVMALLLARQRWASGGTIDYGAEAARLFEVMRGRGPASANASGGATDVSAGGVAGASNGTGGTPSAATAGSGAAVVGPVTFDETTHLVFVEPSTNPSGETGTALLMPGYFSLWAQVTGDRNLSNAAAAARSFLAKVANPATGLMPVRASFTGVPVEAWGNFSAEAYRVLLNLVIDRLWATSDPWQGPQIEALIAFFLRAGIDTYWAAYTLDGSAALILDHPEELILVNGVVASLSNNAGQKQFLEKAWQVPVPIGTTRYYKGLLYLVSNLILGGRFQVCP